MSQHRKSQLERMEDFGEVQQDALRRLAVASEGELKVVGRGTRYRRGGSDQGRGQGQIGGYNESSAVTWTSEEIAESSDEGKAVWVKVCDLLADVVRVEAHQEGD